MKAFSFGLFVILTALVVLPARPQAYKCVEGGKTVYQATPCPGGKAVDTRGSSGVTGLKDDAAKIAEREATPAFDPGTCKFQYYAVGDDLGKRLAAVAKEECLATKGQLGPAYQRWRDHYQTNTARRSAILSGQQKTAPSYKPTPAMRCRPNYVGGMDCN